MRRFRRLAVLLTAVAALALVLSACAIFKFETFSGAQPSGVGAVRLHFALCTFSEEGFINGVGGEEEETGECEPSTREGQGQQMLAFAVPKGSNPPATITASPTPGVAAFTYSRNQEVADRVAELERGEEEPPWPPAGSELVGYLSEVIDERVGEDAEWMVDADFGLPNAADGGSYGGPFNAAVATGWRVVDAEHAASRPISCEETQGETFPPKINASCGIEEETAVKVSDLKIGPGSAAGAKLGGSASISFPFDFASTVPSPPTFALSATTTLPDATVTLPESTYTPGAIAGDAHRAAAASRSVAVVVPATASPGTYNVTLSAKTAAGATVSQSASLTVSQVIVRLGKVKLNKASGSATLSVVVPEAGLLTVSGKKIVKATKNATAARILKVTIKAKGKAKKALRKVGRAKVRATLSFTPLNGAAVVKARSIGLVKRRSH